MKLSISNLAWQKEEDEEMYKICKCMGYDGIEIAPSRIFGENPYQNLDKVDNYRSFLKEKYEIHPSRQFRIKSNRSYIWNSVNDRYRE